MVLTVTLTPASQKVLNRLMAALDRKPFFAVLFQAMNRMAVKAAAFIVRTKLSGQALGRRTGMLAKSMMGEAGYDKNGVPGFRVGVFRGPATRYAGVQEHGTQGFNPDSPYPTIVPKRAKALAMPVDDAVTDAGVALWRSPREYPGKLRFVPFRASGIAVGALYDADSMKRLPGGRGWDYEGARKLWVLLKKVDIKPHWYLRDGLREYLPQVARELTAAMRDHLTSMTAARA